MESKKLLPCPFCNLAAARIIEPANGTTPYVMCTNCTGAGPQLKRDEAIAAWNTRAPADLRSALEAETEAYGFLTDVLFADPGPKLAAARKAATEWWHKIDTALAPTKGDVS